MDAKAWIGCLACYNAGNLKGDWVDGLEAADFVPCNISGHEEWWVMDHECLPVIKGECSPAEFGKAAEWWNEIVAEIDVDAATAWVSFLADLGESWADKTVGDFFDTYSGEFDSPEDFAMEMAEETGSLSADLGWPHNCIDWDRAARELMHDYIEVRGSGTSYFFRSA